MKLYKYLFSLLVLTLFIPRVYAFTYEIDASGYNTSVSVGQKQEITVSIKNIQGDTSGVGACSMNISFDSNISLDSRIRTLNTWSMTTGNFYMFDNGNMILEDSSIFVIPVKVNGEGSVKLTNIKCSDGVTNVNTSDKNIAFTIKTTTNNNNSNSNSNNTNNSNSNSNNTNNNNSNGNSGSNNNSSGVDNNNQQSNNEVLKSSNCDLSNIVLSEGTIEFDSAVTEYSIKINDIDKLEVTPVLDDKSASYTIDKNITSNGTNTIVITVKAQDGNTKIYTIYVESEEVVNEQDSDKKNNIYVPIFIGIICILVLINIIRIIKNKKK